MPDSPPSRSSGLFSSVHRLLDAVADMAEEGTQRRVRFGKDADEEPTGVVGIHVRTVTGGSASETVSVTSFDNRREDKSGEGGADDVREPVVEVHDDDSAVRLVAEMPGVASGDVQVEVTDATCVLEAASGLQSYRATVPLPRSVDADAVTVEAEHGIVTVVLSTPDAP